MTMPGHENFIPGMGLFASCYFTLTGFHALHMVGGLVAFLALYVWAGIESGKFYILVDLRRPKAVPRWCALSWGSSISLPPP